MTNEEIIRETKNLADKHKYDSVLTFGINYHMAFTDIANHIEEQAEENTKLKAEIEQWQSTNLKLVCELTRIECENHQLKSELEQSVKLPCKVGDAVYIVGKCKDFPPKLDGTMWDSDGGFGTATGYYCPYEDSDLCPFKDLEDCSFAEDKLGIFEDVVCHICIEEDKMWYVCENSNGYETNDFGKTVFTTREEAERSLKGGIE